MFNFMRLPPLRRLMLMKAITGGGSWSTISGNPVSFTAKAAPLRQLEVAFSPVQDLHGYDSPWPAGGGVNKFDPSAATDNKRLNYVGEVVDYTGWCVSDWIPCSPNTDYYANYVISSANGYAFCFYDSNKDFLRYSVVSGGGQGVRNSGADAAYMRCTIRLEDKATAGMIAQSSEFLPYSPYSNICPISGWSEINVGISGKNLFNPDSPYHWIINSVNQKEENEANRSVVIPCSQGDKFTISCQRVTGINQVIYVAFADASGTILSRSGSSTATSRTGTAPANAVYCYIGAAQAAAAFVWIQVEVGGTATEYVPYNPSSRSISISLGSTVYSGTVDVVTGVGESKDPLEDFGAYNWESIESDTGLFRTTATNISAQICDTYPIVVVPNFSLMQDKAIRNHANRIYVKDSTYAGVTAAEFKTAVTGIKFINPNATPIPIQLTPQEVESLAGDNNLWSDANQPLTVTYRSN